MRILSPSFVARYLGRMLNIHPSLLPAYRGLHTHRRVLAARRPRAWRERALRDRGARWRPGGAAVEGRGAARRHARPRCRHAFRPPSTSFIRACSAGSQSGASHGMMAPRGSTGAGSSHRSWRIFVPPHVIEARPRARLLARRRSLSLALLLASVAAADELKPYRGLVRRIWHGMTVAVSSLKLEKHRRHLDLHLAQ